MSTVWPRINLDVKEAVSEALKERFTGLCTVFSTEFSLPAYASTMNLP